MLGETSSFVADGRPFNEGYRYVDWLLTVLLLLAALVLVLNLAKAPPGTCWSS